MRRCSLAALTAAALCGLSPLATPVLAQSASPVEITERQPPVVTIDFKGGTVAEYVAALRKAAGEEPVNVVLSKEAADVALTGISLRMVSLDNAVQAIEPAAGSIDGAFSIRRIKPLVATNSGASAVYAVDYQKRFRPIQPGTDRPVGDPEIQVFSLKPLIEPSPEDGPARVTENAETVLTAIQTALDLETSPNVPRADVKYHRESGLLIVRAIGGQLRAVDACLERMRDDVNRRRASIRVSPEDLIERKANIARAEFGVQQSKIQVDIAAKILNQLQAMRDAGNVGEGEITKAEAELQKNHTQLAMAEAEVNRARELLAVTEARAGGNALRGPAILDLSDWPKDHYDQTLTLVRSIYGASDKAPKVETPGGQRILVAGEQWQVESVVTIIREIGRARRLAEPTIGPADQPKPGTGR